jgi:F0F1-type ATP synthase membrane subunit c/vacuolar-type H+-ATPase subunit K
MNNDDSKSTARRWTEIAGWAYIVSGVALAVASLSPGALHFITTLVIPDAGPPVRAEALYAGIGGGLTAGFGAAMAGFARATTMATGARAFAVGLVTWFVVDTGASLGHGSWQNAIGNVVFLALGLAPVWALGASGEKARMERSAETA